MCFSLFLLDEKYECEDGRALIIDDNWAVLCPSNKEILSRSPSVSNTTPSLSPSAKACEYTC